MMKSMKHTAHFSGNGNKGVGGGLYACCPIPHYRKAVYVMAEIKKSHNWENRNAMR